MSKAVVAAADPPGGHSDPAVPLRLPAAMSRKDRRRIGAGGATTDLVNRMLLGLVGLVVAAAGVAGLLLGNGVAHWSETPGSLYRRAASDATGSADLAAAVAMAVCLVVLVLGLWWAFVQLRPVSEGTRLGSLTLDAGGQGRTTVLAAAVARAAGADLASCHGVISARVRLLSVHPVPWAVVVIEMAVDADPSQVIDEASTALGHLAQALEAPTVDVDLRVRYGSELGAGRSSRVR